MSDYIYKVHNAHSTFKSMLTARGYDMSNLIPTDIATFKKLTHRDIYDANSQIYVHFMRENEKLGSENLNKLVNYINESYGDIYIIIVYVIAVSGIDKKIPSKKVQLYNLKDVVIDIAKHDLVPKHEIAQKEEINELAIHYGYEGKIDSFVKKLKGMFKHDAMARYLGADVGTIIKITRPSKSTGYTIDYRVVYEKL